MSTTAGEGEPDSATIGPVDPKALFLALVLVPHSYPRNRFFELYQRRDAKIARRRAAMVRSVIAEFAGDVADVKIQPAERSDYAKHASDDSDALLPGEEPLFTLRYRLPSVDATRVVFVDQFELSLLCDGAQKAAPDEERARAALAPLKEFTLEPSDLNARLSALMGPG